MPVQVFKGKNLAKGAGNLTSGGILLNPPTLSFWGVWKTGRGIAGSFGYQLSSEEKIDNLKEEKCPNGLWCLAKRIIQK